MSTYSKEEFSKAFNFWKGNWESENLKISPMTVDKMLSLCVGTEQEFIDRQNKLEVEYKSTLNKDGLPCYWNGVVKGMGVQKSWNFQLE